MARRKRYHKPGMLSGLKRKAGSVIGSAVQILGFGHGAIRAVSDRLAAQGGWDRLPHDMLFYYSGFDSDSGNLNTGQTIQSAGIIVVSWLVGKGIKYVANH